MRRAAAIVADAVSALIGNGCVIDARNKCSLGWWIFSSFEITCKGVKFNVEKVQTFKSLFINEFRPGHSAQKIENTIVYHYTGACSLLSILENECVRFSDIRYMNDRSETIFFFRSKAIAFKKRATRLDILTNFDGRMGYALRYTIR